MRACYTFYSRIQTCTALIDNSHPSAAGLASVYIARTAAIECPLSTRTIRVGLDGVVPSRPRDGVHRAVEFSKIGLVVRRTIRMTTRSRAIVFRKCTAAVAFYVTYSPPPTRSSAVSTMIVGRDLHFENNLLLDG